VFTLQKFIAKSRKQGRRRNICKTHEEFLLILIKLPFKHIPAGIFFFQPFLPSSTPAFAHFIFLSLHSLLEPTDDRLDRLGGGRRRLEGGVFPLGQIDPRQQAGLAGHAGVDVVIREDHGVHLHRLQLVRVVAEDAGELGAAQLRQLLWREGGGPAGVLVPEAVAHAQRVELAPDDAGEDGSHQRALA